MGESNTQRRKESRGEATESKEVSSDTDGMGEAGTPKRKLRRVNTSNIIVEGQDTRWQVSGSVDDRKERSKG